MKLKTEILSRNGKEKVFGSLRRINLNQKIFVRFPNGHILIGKYNSAAQLNCTAFIHNGQNIFEQSFLDDWLYSPEKLMNNILCTPQGTYPIDIKTNRFIFCNECNEQSHGMEKIEMTDGEFTWTGIGCYKCQRVKHGLSNMSHEFYTKPEQKMFNITETRLYCPLWARDYLSEFNSKVNHD